MIRGGDEAKVWSVRMSSRCEVFQVLSVWISAESLVSWPCGRAAMCVKSGKKGRRGVIICRPFFVGASFRLRLRLVSKEKSTVEECVWTRSKRRKVWKEMENKVRGGQKGKEVRVG